MISNDQFRDAYSLHEGYLSALRARDPETEAHFVSYFSRLLRNRLRQRLISSETARDVSQETLARVVAAVRSGEVRHPERFSAFVSAVCNSILRESYKNLKSLGDLNTGEWPSPEEGLLTFETKSAVQLVLAELPERDHLLLQAIFFEQRDKDDVCKQFGVSREYLRVLLHRAKQNFMKAWSVRRAGITKQAKSK